MRFMLDGLEVFFPYDYVYKEQYQYMLELKRALDARGHGLLEMPTGTGKTVSLLSLITSYQAAHPETTGKLIYCTRTVPEMSKTVDELKRVLGYRREQLEAAGRPGGPETLAVCLSSRRNLCIHPDLGDESDKEKVDAGCRSMTASWVRAKAQAAAGAAPGGGRAGSGASASGARAGGGGGGGGPVLCEFFEGWDASGTDAEIRGIYTLEDMKALGAAKGWCPYFTARHVISYASVVVFNYQYMLDPKIASLVSKELDDRSIVVFDEAHNIDNVCIEALSVTLDRRLLDGAAANLSRLGTEVKAMKQADAGRLQAEYNRLVAGLGAGGALGDNIAAAGAHGHGGGGGGGGGVAGGEEEGLASAAAGLLPAAVLAEAVPGSIRNAELFVRFMKHIVSWLRERVKVGAVVTETPTAFLTALQAKLGVDTKPLRFCYNRLSSLLRTLQVTGIDEFGPLSLVADFCTLLATYPAGFMIISEPYASRMPHIPDPIMQLTCLDASLAMRPVFERFASVILTSGTLSPLDMYPKMLAFEPCVRVSLEMSITRPCICPLVVSRGSDQTPLSTKFELRDDPNVMRNYGALLLQTCATVPDGVVAFFPSYSYMEFAVSAWHGSGLLGQLEGHKLLFIETKDVVETTLSLANYKKACDIGRGALFLSVARGKVAEGIDFDRHYGRAVVVIGIPFQFTLSHVLRARLAYLAERYGIREQDFLTFDAIRHASQCVGRIIRSKRDYGIIVFADKRYGNADKRGKLPSWVLQFLPDAHLALSVDMAAHICRKFLKEQAQPLAPGAAERERGTTFLTAEDIEALNEGLRAAPRPALQQARSGGGGGTGGGASGAGAGAGGRAGGAARQQPAPLPPGSRVIWAPAGGAAAAVAAARASDAAAAAAAVEASPRAGGAMLGAAAGGAAPLGLAGFAAGGVAFAAEAAGGGPARMAGSGFLRNVGSVALPLLGGSSAAAASAHAALEAAEGGGAAAAVAASSGLPAGAAADAGGRKRARDELDGHDGESSGGGGAASSYG